MATTEQYLTQLQTDKTNLVANLVEKGVEASDTETFTSLVPKVLDIETGGGGDEGALVTYSNYRSDGYPSKARINKLYIENNGLPANLFQVGYGGTTNGSPYSYFLTEVEIANNLVFSELNNFMFEGLRYLKSIKLPDNTKTLVRIGTKCFNGCVNFQIDELPSTINNIGQNAFAGCTKLNLKKLPNIINYLQNSCFENCTSLAIEEIPSGVTTLNQSIFSGCSSLKKINVLGNITQIAGYVFYNCTSLKTVALENVTSVPTLSNSNAFPSTIEAIGVPNDLVDSFKTATNWSTIADKIVPVDLKTIEIKDSGINTYNNNSVQLELLYNGLSYLLKKEQEGVTWSAVGNATIDTNGLLTLTENAQVGDIITVTAISNYDNSITDTANINVYYKEQSYSINLNDGQWVDSGTTVNGNIVYKSDAGSYNVNNGKSIATITLKGYDKFVIQIRSYAEDNYDYTEAFALDTEAVRASGLFTSRGKQYATDYIECVYETDGLEHTIQIMYSKDGSGNTNDDRGYFYVDGGKLQ